MLFDVTGPQGMRTINAMNVLYICQDSSGGTTIYFSEEKLTTKDPIEEVRQNFKNALERLEPKANYA